MISSCPWSMAKTSESVEMRWGVEIANDPTPSTNLRPRLDFLSSSLFVVTLLILWYYVVISSPVNQFYEDACSKKDCNLQITTTVLKNV